MIKLSEALKSYKSRSPIDEVDRYFSEQLTEKKISDLEILIRVLGDVEFEIDSLKAFLYKVGQITKRFGVTTEDTYKQIKTMYDLIKDSKLSSYMICTLFDYYQLGAYELFKDEIKEFFTSSKDDDKESLSQMLKTIILKATAIAEQEAMKLEDLKEEYGKEFITKLQSIIRERFIPYDKVISILPSKELIDSSITEAMGITIVSGEDLVTRRLRGYISDEAIEQTDMDDQIKLGYDSYGDYVYASFTKKEYLESLKSQKSKSLIKRKK